MSRYEDLFATLKSKNEGAFVPFIMLGDPDADTSFSIIEAVIEAGADALELGVPFSDPVADGPTIQDSHLRALDAGVDVDTCFGVVKRIRDTYPSLPIGLLIYGNVPFARGLDSFYSHLAKAGADSVLIPDVPVREGRPFKESANRHGIDQIFIAPPSASEQTIASVAAYSTGYIYAVSRLGVTGTEVESSTEGLSDIVTYLEGFHRAPALLGFGISTPDHVANAIAAGAAGAISGSAITKIIARHCVGQHPDPRTVDDKEALRRDLINFVSAMKAATRR
ncbi:tryptophan synthase subunit alpha [Corynebacterium mendelii]|uniref:Tryptophan synthase alpha chain n=1 Tax=Corynebacterium mendelii TaxID=2765362 RepID=A0A939IXT0_9CORY|nr:tryptophan synthase subunit alpha [Corynebacterium mendelii]MBN9644378.1 tryptophan synthase subunit alpha [Corynebacterium mendelii]